jgi:hypothetical protein
MRSISYSFTHVDKNYIIVYQNVFMIVSQKFYHRHIFLSHSCYLIGALLLASSSLTLNNKSYALTPTRFYYNRNKYECAYICRKRMTKTCQHWCFFSAFCAKFTRRYIFLIHVCHQTVKKNEQKDSYVLVSIYMIKDWVGSSFVFSDKQ